MPNKCNQSIARQTKLLRKLLSQCTPGCSRQGLVLAQALGMTQAVLNHREVARDLSQCCSQLGLVHAAVLFEHASFGASVSLQYRGILHSKLLALERRHLCGSATPEAEQASHMKRFTVMRGHDHVLQLLMQPCKTVCTLSCTADNARSALVVELDHTVVRQCCCHALTITLACSGEGQHKQPWSNCAYHAADILNHANVQVCI